MLFRSVRPSPDGQRAVVVARGEVFTVPAKEGPTRNLTQTPGTHERGASWSPDGKWLLFAGGRKDPPGSAGADKYDIYKIASDGSGDEIRLTTQTGVYVYRATGSEVVPPSDYRLVVPTADRNTATLAIATCTPIGTARDRLVVHAMLDRSLSDPIFSGTTGTVAPATTTADVPAGR